MLLSVQPFFQVISFASSHLIPWKGPLAVKRKTYLGIKIYSKHSVHTLTQMLQLWLMISSEWIFIAKESLQKKKSKNILGFYNTFIIPNF